jgi:hypothetical protein
MHDDSPQATTTARPLSAREQLSLALDGMLPVGEVRAADAMRAAMWMDQDWIAPVMARLQEIGRHGVVTVSGPFDPLHRLLSVLGVAHTVASELADVTTSAQILVLGCRHDTGGLDYAIDSLKDRRVTLLTSDKSALLRTLSGALRPMSPCPGRVARLVWETDAGPVCRSGMLPGVRLSAGHVPLDIDESTSPVRVLARDAQTREPIVVLARVGKLTVVHSVAHWWQRDPLGMTAVDTRPLSEIAALTGVAGVSSHVRYGELQAARAMLAGLTLGIAAGFSLE